MSVSPISIARSSFNGGEVAPTLYYRNTLDSFQASCKRLKNFQPHPHGGASNRAGFEFIDETKDSATKSILVPFQFSVVQSYVLLFGVEYMRIYKDGGFVETSPASGVHVEIETPYQEADLRYIKIEQSADTLYVTHPSYPPVTITRTSHTAWSLDDIVFGSGQNPPTLLTGGSGTTYKYAVTAVNDDEIESVTSNEVSSSRSVTLTWTVPSGTTPAYYRMYEKENGTWYYIGRSDTNSFAVPASPSTHNPDITPPQTVTIFNAADKYPGVAAFFDQRLIFGRTNERPQTLNGSVIGDFQNMNYSSPVQDNDAFSFTINSTQVNEIRWIAALTQCIIGTSGGEWVMRPGGNNTTITPTSVDIKVQSRWGCADIKPIIIGNSVIFVEGSRKAVRNMSYSLELDGYDGSNLTILAQHLFQDYGIVSWAYQQYPDSIIWCVREDGALCGMTYMAEHKIRGWHQHSTDGFFEDIACITSAPGVNEVWAIVRRTIDGATKRYVERMHVRSFSDIKYAFFVDCGLTQEFAEPVKVVSGLDHLEGKTVVVLADGSVITGLTVFEGAIRMKVAATVVTVGLPYTCDLETLDFTALTQEGEIAYKNRRVVSAIVVADNTREFWIGGSESTLIEQKFRTTEPMGEPTQPFTGTTKTIAIKPNSDTRNSSLFVRVINPVPVTIQTLIAHVNYGSQ